MLCLLASTKKDRILLRQLSAISSHAGEVIKEPHVCEMAGDWLLDFAQGRKYSLKVCLSYNKP